MAHFIRLAIHRIHRIHRFHRILTRVADHLGQFRIPIEKMLPYETDIRIPLFIKGPVRTVPFLHYKGICPPALLIRSAMFLPPF